ncbi:putative ribonuclease H-like domain-containing protein [Tanacetum coccineum]
MDVKSAFLYGTIEEEVYVTQPPGFKDPDHPDKVYKVVKDFYGLHQALRSIGISKEVGTPRYLSLVVPLTKVSDDAVHKELGDRMERAATTASSLEAEQDSEGKTSMKARDRTERFTKTKAEHEESIPTPSNDLQPSGCSQAKEIVALKKRIETLERRKMSRPTGLKRLSKVRMSRRVESSMKQESLGAPEDASKQGRSIADIDADVKDVEMPVEAKVDGENEQSTKPDDSTAGEAITTASIDDSTAAKPKVVTTAATTATTTRPKDRGVVVQELSEFRVPQETKPSSSKDKGKGIMIEPEVPLKRKDQIALDEQIARDIQANYDGTADRTAGERLQSRKEEELTDEEKARLFMENAMEKRRSILRLEVQESNEKKKVRRFTEETAIVCMKEDAWEGKEQEIKLKKLLVIKKDEDIAIDAIPLATKLPVIIDYKLHKEGLLVHYEFIRAYGSSNRYSSMKDLIQEIRLEEDLEALWRIVKAKYGDTRPESEFERVLYEDLKVMFEPDIKSDVWRMLQGYRVTIWKLIDSFGVHFVKFDNLHIFMLVERRYPLTPITITNMLNKRLQTDHQNDMCYQLLKLMVKQ